MTALRITFATLVIVLGLCYCVVGVLALVTLHSIGTAAFPALAVASWLLMIPLSLIAVSCGVGLLLLLPWSGRVWLSTSAFLIVFHLFWLVQDLSAGSDIFSLLPAIAIVLFCAASWLLLKSDGTQRLFS